MMEETFTILFHLCQHARRWRQVRIEHAGELRFNTGEIVFTVIRQIEQLGNTFHPVTKFCRPVLQADLLFTAAKVETGLASLVSDQQQVFIDGTDLALT